MDDRSPSPALTLGAILIIIGLLLFVGQLTGFSIGDLGWPMIVVGIGVVLLLVGLFVNREEGLVVAGTITTTVGLVLLYVGLVVATRGPWSRPGPLEGALAELLVHRRTDGVHRPDLQRLRAGGVGRRHRPRRDGVTAREFQSLFRIDRRAGAESVRDRDGRVHLPNLCLGQREIHLQANRCPCPSPPARCAS